MASNSTMYNYIDKYISKHTDEEFRRSYNNRIRAFLYMNISDKRDADEGIYEDAQNLFKENKEFRDLVIGCLANMKRVYANEIDNKRDFDGIYKTLCGLAKQSDSKFREVSGNLDRDYDNLSSKYKFISSEEKGFSL